MIYDLLLKTVELREKGRLKTEYLRLAHMATAHRGPACRATAQAQRFALPFNTKALSDMAKLQERDFEELTTPSESVIIFRIMNIFSLFRKSNANDTGSPTSRLVMDGTSLAASGNGGAVRPLDQLQILDRYGKFCQREKISLTILFTGKPLRELDSKGRYGDVQVIYAEQPDLLPRMLRRTLKSGNRATTLVVTGATEMADAAKAMGVAVMHDKTIRKVVERVQSNRGSSNPKSSRQRSGGSANTVKNNNAESKPDKQPDRSKNNTDDSKSAIDELIDRV